MVRDIRLAVAGAGAVLLAGCLMAQIGCSSSGAETRRNGAGTGGGSLIAAGMAGSGNSGANGIGSIVLPEAGTGGGSGPCENGGWACAIDQCNGSPESTTVRAKVYDPAGKNPLYNVIVYVNNAALDPIASGATCDACVAATGQPIAAAITDTSGAFVMKTVPSGKNVPLVMQIGKWRRSIVLPEVKPCQENVFDDHEQFRLPRSQAEGNIPKMAITTGEADTLECLLRRIGIADTEFTNPTGMGRINLFSDTGGSSSYSSGGGSYPSYTELVATGDSFKAYDVVLMNCTGSQSDGRKYTTDQKQALKDYVDGGGRAFLEHYHHAWLRGMNEDPAIEKARKYLPTPFPPVATWATPDNTDLDNGFSGTTHDFNVDTTFQRGSDMADWLQNVKATKTKGTISLFDVKNPALATLAGSQRWIYDDNANPSAAPDPTSAVPYFSSNTPFGSGDAACGRLVHTGIHVSGVAMEKNGAFPAECKVADLTPQEQAMEFMLFDLSSCITPDNRRTEVSDVVK
jgi:hypothetical protein